MDTFNTAKKKKKKLPLESLKSSNFQMLGHKDYGLLLMTPCNYKMNPIAFVEFKGYLWLVEVELRKFKK